MMVQSRVRRRPGAQACAVSLHVCVGELSWRVQGGRPNMWEPAPFSRASVAESVRSVVVLLVGSMVAASRVVVLPRLLFKSPRIG